MPSRHCFSGEVRVDLPTKGFMLRFRGCGKLTAKHTCSMNSPDGFPLSSLFFDTPRMRTRRCYGRCGGLLPHAMRVVP